MCGIIIVVGFQGTVEQLQQKLRDASRKIRHRGPDWSGVEIFATPNGLVGFAHERLSIVDPEGGSQPLFSKNKKHVLCVNGEIYNHEELKRGRFILTNHLIDLKEAYSFSTKSDCEAILSTYVYFEKVKYFANVLPKLNDVDSNMATEWVKLLDGQFAFGLYSKKEDKLLIARDPIGIVPLYCGEGRDGSIWFASEMKAIIDEVTHVKVFSPGTYMVVDPVKKFVERYKYYRPGWYKTIPPQDDSEMSKLYPKIREVLEKAVVKRLMCDVPYGVLLSGGLDSSLIASIVSRYCSKRVESGGKEVAHFPVLHTFSIGMKSEGGEEVSPDLINAEKVSKHINSVHHAFTFTMEEALHVLPQIIYHLETYDVTTIRASTPMFLLARRIKSMGIKMVLSGEGADEIFGGYLYFHKAPDRVAFHEELVRKIRALHKYDCLRANKSTMAWGLETRVPFLDQEVLDMVMNIDPTHKMINKTTGNIEKYILRKAFDTKGPSIPYLPYEILWRQKEQFSDGVGYSWIDGLKEEASKFVKINIKRYFDVHSDFPYNTPMTDEAFWYRCLFDTFFGHNNASEKTVPGGPSVACSSATAASWDEKWKGMEDPSGRTVKGVHNK